MTMNRRNFLSKSKLALALPLLPLVANGDPGFEPVHIPSVFTTPVTPLDDTDIIQTAIDRASRAGGGIVKLEPRQYRITRTIHGASNVTVYGNQSELVGHVLDGGPMIKIPADAHSFLVRDMRISNANALDWPVSTPALIEWTPPPSPSHRFMFKT